MSGDAFGREVLRLALPAFGALAAPSLLILSDSAFVGTLGTKALAGMAMGGAVLGIAIGLSYFLAYATTSVVARRFGAGQVREAIEDGLNYVVLGLLLGVACALILAGFSEYFVRWIGHDDDAMALGVDWLRAAAVGAPATMASMATIGLFRGLQDTRITFAVTTSQVLGNIALCAWFVFGLHLGIRGAGLAWAVAETLGFLAYLAVLLRLARRSHVHLHRMRWGDLGRALRVGLPLLCRSFAMRVVLTGTTVVAAGLGTDELAAFNVSLQIWYILANLLDALAVAAQAIIGRRLGASEGRLLHGIVNRLLRWSVVYGAVVGAATLALSPYAPMLFTQAPKVQHLLTLCLVVIAAHQPIAAVAFLLDGVLVGSGDTVYIAFVLTMGMMAFLPIAWAVSHFDLGVVGLWGAMIAFISTRAALMFRRARTDAWIVEGATR